MSQPILPPQTTTLLLKLLPPTLLTALTIPLLSAAYTNYNLWLSIGPGGVPYNIFGWALQSTVSLFLSNDLLSTKVYDDPKSVKVYGERCRERFIEGDLGRREGVVPVVPNFVAPQRQVGGGSGGRVRELQEKLLSEIVASNPETVTIKTSGLEKRGPALFLLPNIPLPPGTQYTGGEIAHIHLAAEGSSHVSLSLADAKEVIEKGWGRRHKLSGSLVPVSYLFIYAPRSEEEVNVLERILRAGVAFMTADVEKKGI